MHDLHCDIQFAQPARLQFCSRLALEFGSIKLGNVADMADPMIVNVTAARSERRHDATATVVPADNDVFYAKGCHCKVDDR